MSAANTSAPADAAQPLFTPGNWSRIAMGGSSTVVSDAKPQRNDNRIPAYGYDDSNGHCLAYPFIEDGGRVRLDFVCFSHEDANLMAAAKQLFAVAIRYEAWETSFALWCDENWGSGPTEIPLALLEELRDIQNEGTAAIAKALGQKTARAP